MRDIEPYISIKPQSLYIYGRPTYDWERTQSHIGNLYKYSNKVLTNKAVKRIREITNVLVLLSKKKTLYSKSDNKYYYFKLSFITLTLPVATNLSDSYIMRNIFSVMLKILKQRNPDMLYIYKCEVSDNGRLHIHITSNIFIHHAKLRKLYLKILTKNNIIDEGASYPCSEVRAVRNVSKIAAYISSYITKKDNYDRVLKRWHHKYDTLLSHSTNSIFNLPRTYFKHIKRKVECRIWDCSKALKVSRLNSPLYLNQNKEYIDKLESDVNTYISQSDYGTYYGISKCDKSVLGYWNRLIREHYTQAVATTNLSDNNTVYELD